MNADRSVSNNNKNRQIVISLYEKGIFDIKDAINLVADRLAISRHTVYLYIRQIKQEQRVMNYVLAVKSPVYGKQGAFLPINLPKLYSKKGMPLAKFSFPRRCE